MSEIRAAYIISFFAAAHGISRTFINLNLIYDLIQYATEWSIGGEVSNEGLSWITTILSFAADIWEIYWRGVWSISHRKSLDGIVAFIIASNLIVFAAPVVAVENFSLSGGIVVIICWVIVMCATCQIMFFAAVTFRNAVV